jgi:hypothetical protein
VWAAVGPTAAAAVHRDIEAGSTRAACSLLLNRAVELLPLAGPHMWYGTIPRVLPRHFLVQAASLWAWMAKV